MNSTTPRTPRRRLAARLLCIALASALGLGMSSPSTPVAARTAGEVVRMEQVQPRDLGPLRARIVSIDYDNAPAGAAADEARVTVAFTLSNPGMAPVIVLPNKVVGFLGRRSGGASIPSGPLTINGQADAGFAVRPRQEVAATMQFRLKREMMSDLNAWNLALEGEGNSPRTRRGSAHFDLPSPAGAPGSPPPPAPADMAPAQDIKFASDDGFQTMGSWAARLDEVKYGVANGAAAGETRRVVEVFATIRNVSQTSQMFSTALLESTMTNDTSVHTPRFGFGWVRSTGGWGDFNPQIVPRGEDRKIRFQFEVREEDQPRLQSWTLVERNVVPTLTGRNAEKGRATFTLPAARPVEPAASGYSSRFGDGWYASIDRVDYSAPQAGRTDVTVRVKFENHSRQALTLTKDEVKTLLDRRSGLRMSPADFQLTSGASPQSGPSATAEPGGDVFAEFLFRVGDEPAQRDVHMLTLVRRERVLGGPWSDTDTIVQLPVAGYGASSTQTAAAASVGGADLAKYEGRYRTNRGTILALKAVAGELVGEAMTVDRPTPRETVKLTMHADGSLRGAMRDETGVGRYVWYDLNLRFSPDGGRFAGQASPTHAANEGPLSYTGVRLAEAGKTGAGAAQPGPPTRIGPYDVALVSLQKGADGDWETTWSLTNRSQAATTVNLNSLAVVIRGPGGDASEARGPYHYAGETGRRVRRSGFEIAPGEETRIRFWHSGSRALTPSTYSFLAGSDEGRGDLPAVAP